MVLNEKDTTERERHGTYFGLWFFLPGRTMSAVLLREEATALVAKMRSLVDPSTARTVVGSKTHPNLVLAAAGLGLHRGLFKNASQAMQELEKHFAGSITASIQKNPKKAKDWQMSFARYDELILDVMRDVQLHLHI